MDYYLVELPLTIDSLYLFVVFYSRLLHPAYKTVDQCIKTLYTIFHLFTVIVTGNVCNLKYGVIRWISKLALPMTKTKQSFI